MIWNPLTPVFIIFIGFYSISYSSDCQGKPRRITVKVVLDVRSFLNTQEDERRRCHPQFGISPPFTPREPVSSLQSLQPHANMLSHSIHSETFKSSGGIITYFLVDLSGYCS